MGIGIDVVNGYWGLCIAAVISVVTCAYRLYKAEGVMTNAIEVEGTVIEYEERIEKDDDGAWDLLDGKYYYAQVEYKVSENVSYVHTYSIRSKVKEPSLGEKITIYYSESEPEKSLDSNEYSSMTVDYLILVVSGLVLIYVVYMMG